MVAQGSNSSKDDLARRGEMLYERDIRACVASRSPDEYVAIDVNSGEYEVGADQMGVLDRLSARRPDAQIWLRRVGSLSTRHFGRRHLNRRGRA